MTPKRHGIQQLLDAVLAQAAPGAEAAQPVGMAASFLARWMEG